VISSVLAAGCLILAGLPLSYALTRRVVLAFALGPLVAALFATGAVVAMLLFGGALGIWLSVAFALQIASALLFFRRWEAVPDATTADLLWLTIPLLPPMALAVAPPTAWDSHSIWWMHAGYFAKGADVAREAMSAPAVMFSHPDYPPLPSAPVAALWQFTGRVDFRVAHSASALVTFSAIVLLAVAVRQVLSRSSPALARAAGVAVGLATWATAPFSVTSGYSDALWAAAFVAGAVPLLFGRAPRAIDFGLLMVAALSKNEGLIAVGVLAVLLTFRRGHPGVWRLWVPVAAGVVWAMLARLLGATSDLESGGRFTALLTFDPAVWRRLAPTLVALWSSAGIATVSAAVVALAGAVALRSRRTAFGLPGDGWLWGVLAAYAGCLIVTYLISPHDITWHLATSASRVSLPLVLLAGVSAATWVVVAADRPPSPPSVTRAEAAVRVQAQPAQAPAADTVPL